MVKSQTKKRKTHKRKRDPCLKRAKRDYWDQGGQIEYEDTPTTEKLRAEVRELNAGAYLFPVNAQRFGVSIASAIKSPDFQYCLTHLPCPTICVFKNL